jgi:hypothetical protein
LAGSIGVESIGERSAAGPIGDERFLPAGGVPCGKFAGGGAESINRPRIERIF